MSPDLAGLSMSGTGDGCLTLGCWVVCGRGEDDIMTGGGTLRSGVPGNLFTEGMGEGGGAGNLLTGGGGGGVTLPV